MGNWNDGVFCLQAAQVATVAARDAFDQIQQRIGIEQGSDARRLDLLSAEIARITRDIADTRGEDAAKRQILEANIARVEGQKAVDNTSQQFLDVRQKLNQTELQVVALIEQIQDERRLRAEAETRLDVAISRMAELNDAREGSMVRKFSSELDNARLELARALSDEKEEAQTRDDHIVRDKDEQLAQWEKVATKERARNLEHQLILEKAVREEHDQRVNQMDAMNKGLDRVNHEVTQALRDEMQTRELRENKLRGQISQSVLKLHAANKDTRDKLTQERDEIHATLKTEIKSRMHHLALLERHMRDAQVDTKQTIRSVEVSLANRINATDQKVDIEMNMIQKLVARQSKLETDFVRFSEDIVCAFDTIQEDLTVAAVSQALNTECDNVQAEYVSDTAADILEVVEAQDKRDKANHEKLSRAVFGDDPENGGVGLLPRAQKTEADVARLQRQELRIRDDIDGVNERHDALRAEVESAQCLHAVDVESIQAELDAGAADRAAIFDDVEHKVKEQIKHLREENVSSMRVIESGIDDKFVDFRTKFGRKLGSLEYTTEEFQDFVVHQSLENEAIRIDAETYAEARLGKEQDKRLAALADLKQHVTAVVADEANQRRLGDSDTRRALQDDIADLEDTAADAVRELREGLRDEISERKFESEALHRDLGEALNVARSRLECDVRALEEQASGNIAAQKLEEELMRAELDDAMQCLQDGVEEVKSKVGEGVREALGEELEKVNENLAKVKKDTEETMKERLKDVVTSLVELTEDVEAVKARAAAGGSAAGGSANAVAPAAAAAPAATACDVCGWLTRIDGRPICLGGRHLPRTIVGAE